MNIFIIFGNTKLLQINVLCKLSKMTIMQHLNKPGPKHFILGNQVLWGSYMSWGSFTNFYRIYENHLMAPIKLQILLQDLFAIK